MRTEPLSTFQADYWHRDRARPGAPAVVLRAFDIDGPPDASGLRERLADAILRHEALRTRFVEVDGEPRQIVEPSAPAVMRVADLRGRPPAEVSRRVRAEREEPFDLTAAPLVRVTLLRTAEDSHVVLIAVHHIVCDGWSASLLAGELLGGGAVAASRYTDFVAWERATTGERLPSAVAYWKPRLEPVPSPHALPAFRPRSEVRAYRGERVEFAWPSSLAERLTAFARARRASPFMVLLTAFTAALHTVTGDRDLAVASLFAGRDRAEFETMVGLLARTTVFRVDLSGDPAGDELLARVRGVVLDTHEHAAVPLRPVAEEIFGSEAQTVLSRLWDVWFNLLPDAPPPAAGVRPRPPEADLVVRKDERDWEGENVTVTVTGLRPELRGHLDVNALLITRETAVSLLETFERTLRRLLDDSGLRLSEL